MHAKYHLIMGLIKSLKNIFHDVFNRNVKAAVDHRRYTLVGIGVIYLTRNLQPKNAVNT